MDSPSKASSVLPTLRITMAAALIACLFVAAAKSQSPSPGKTSPSPAENTPSPTASGNVSVETQMLSYAAMNAIAREIASRIAAHSSDQCAHTILVQDQNTIAQLTAFEAFRATMKALLNSYRQRKAGFVAGGAPSDYLSEAASIMTAIRSTATYTNQAFQPSAASMSNMLITQLGNLTPSFALYSSTAPGDLLAAGQQINQQLADVDNAQSALTDASKRTDLDAVYKNLKAQLASSSPDGTILGTIIKGAALAAALQQGYCVLSYSVDGAGGETRVAHPFFWEVLFPTPHPSYSGGAIVSFVYSTHDGKYLTGDSLRYMYGFSKWQGCKLKAPSNLGRESDICNSK